MISEVELAHPQFLVVVECDLSWLPILGSPQQLSFSAWSNNYVRSNYELIGVTDRVDDHTVFRWGDEAKNYQPTSNTVVEVFKRRA
jgi:hypothetical protein